MSRQIGLNPNRSKEIIKPFRRLNDKNHPMEKFVAMRGDAPVFNSEEETLIIHLRSKLLPWILMTDVNLFTSIRERLGIF
jgi:hypothetical protein